MVANFAIVQLKVAVDLVREMWWKRTLWRRTGLQQVKVPPGWSEIRRG